jgi:hypothetical protein
VILPSHDLPFVPLSNSGRDVGAIRGEPSIIARKLPLFKSLPNRTPVAFDAASINNRD